MNDKKFLAQLNLYLDGEIDAAEAAALEQEILANPGRRRVYNDYCRIHRATKLVYEQFRAAGAAHDADLSPNRPLADAQAASAAFNPGGRTGGRAAPRPFRHVAFVGGLAAACAVGVFIGTYALSPRAPQTPAAAPALAVSDPAPVAPVVATVAPVVTERPVVIAPFAAQFRADPYVVQLPETRPDPFALEPWTNEDDSSSLTAASMAGGTVLKVDPRLRTVSQGLDERDDPQVERRKNPFRVQFDQRSPAGSAFEFTTQSQ